MGTPYDKIFKLFLDLIEDLDWALEDDYEVVYNQLASLMRMAVFKFKRPRIPLIMDDVNQCFELELTSSEIQVIVILMRAEYRNKELDKWQNNTYEFEDVDHRKTSKANFIDKLQKNVLMSKKEAKEALQIYDRTNDARPLRELAGGSRR